jgi:hypothetical protein
MKLMLRLVEAVNKRELNRTEFSIAAGKKKKRKRKQQQQHRWRGEKGQLQKRIWDLGGFQHWRRGAHEKDLMFLLEGEYDAGESIHLRKCFSMPTRKNAMEEGRGIKPPILKFEIILYIFLCCKAVNVRPYLCIGSVLIALKGYL